MTGEVGRKRTVLLADGDERRRRATAVHLRLGGYRVLEVGALREVPGAAREGIDILVSDAELTDGSAIAYAAYLRRDARTSSLPILIITTEPDLARQARDALGSAGSMLQPIAPSVLLDRIAQLLTPSGATA